jgi:hypothetical protein
MNSLQRLEHMLTAIYDNNRHLETAADQVYMASLRTGVNLDELLDEIQSNNLFNIDSFVTASKGNVFEYISEEFQNCVKRFVNITAGGNGGMASIGRGEFMISFSSNFKAKISKSGKGDLEYVSSLIDKILNEEMKWNGGKINVAETQGKEVSKNLLSLLRKNGEDHLLVDSDFVPFRKSDKKKYSSNVLNILNARFWQSLTGENVNSLTDNQLKELCLRRAFDSTFSKSDSILIVNDDGEFVRFTNAADAVEYYNAKIGKVELEIRSKQTNPISIYLFV